MTTLLDGPRAVRPIRLWQLALLAASAIAFGHNALIHLLCRAEPSSVQGPPALLDGDQDGDGLSNTEEDALSRQFAPVVILDAEDTHRPASIEWLLARTEFFRVTPKAVLAGAAELVASTTASRLPESTQAGSKDRRNWITYVHVHPRADGGVNVQYWFFYPFSNGPLFFDHDSDWEHLTFELDPQRKARGVHLAQHENDHPGRFHAWSELTTLSGQPVFYSAGGTHATYARPEHVAWFERTPSCRDPSRCETQLWKTWEEGGLQNLGERGQPRRPNPALLHRGRWGSSGLLPGTSAPYGPLYHRGFCVHGVSGCLASVEPHQ